jgi:hypothetical protein
MATKTATQKNVTVLARYALKNTGSVIYHVRNGENKEYNVGLHPSGHTTCTCKHGENAGNAAHCYHVSHCQQAEQARKQSHEDENAARNALHALYNVDGLNDY